jgi:hypothetical protein
VPDANPARSCPCATEATARFVAHSGPDRATEPSSGLPLAAARQPPTTASAGCFGSARGARDRRAQRRGAARPNQGIGNELISGRPETGTGAVVVRERLGGLLKHYHRAA